MIKNLPRVPPGGDIRSFVVLAVVGDWEPSFKYIDSFPSLASWSAMVEAERGEGKEITEIMAGLNKPATCSGNTLHRAEELEYQSKTTFNVEPDPPKRRVFAARGRFGVVAQRGFGPSQVYPSLSQDRVDYRKAISIGTRVTQ